jgi:hypothetical protein
VEVGVIAIDGTKLSANASVNANCGYERIVEEILQEADATDRAEDELYGERRGDELPEQLRTREGRRRAFREAKLALDADRDADSDTEGSEAAAPVVELEIDVDRKPRVNSEMGRRGWIRKARRQLDDRRAQEARPVPGSRPERLLDAKRRLEENHQAELIGNAAYEQYRALGVAKHPHRFGLEPKPYTPPPGPDGIVNLTDPDSRVMRTRKQPPIQGYNAQAAVNENQIIVAAELTIETPDFGHLEPMVDAACTELEKAGVTESPGTVVADAGYWHRPQMENIIAHRGIQVLVPPDGARREGTRPGWNKGWYAWMRRVLETDLGHELYIKRMAMIEPVFGQIKFNRGFTRVQRRGRSAARADWRLAAATHNLLKLHHHQLATTGS